MRLAQFGALALSLLVSGSAFSQQQRFNTIEAAKNGWFAEQSRSATWYLSQHKRLTTASWHGAMARRGVHFILQQAQTTRPQAPRKGHHLTWP
jgi:hypothetical protein